MATTKLPAKVVKLISTAVDTLFDRAKVRFLGPNIGGKKLYVKIDPMLTLPGVFEEAHIDEGGIPDIEMLKLLLSTTENYLDAEQARAKARLLKLAQEHLINPPEDGDLYTALYGDLADVWGQVANKVEEILDTESSHVRGIGSLDGIVRSNAALGVDDPTVCFIIVRDSLACDECVHLHMLDLVTPRVWRLSEVSHGYHVRGEDRPSIGGLHPHCRCTMTTILRGFGFDSTGRVAYIRDGYDVFKDQRG